MYKFIKEIDPNNRFDKTTVTVEIPQSDIGLEELIESFADFLKGCGYSPKGIQERLFDDD